LARGPRLDPIGDVLRVSVEDDGRGLEAGEASRHGDRFGLLGMRERVEGLGGRLDLDSEPGRGLRLVATIPLAATEDRAT
jgi:two-component system sensor histidine kinase UhpB